MTPRCKDYLTDETKEADIVISADRYNPAKYGDCDYDLAAYLDSGFEFYGNLLRFDGLMLHASKFQEVTFENSPVEVELIIPEI